MVAPFWLALASCVALGTWSAILMNLGIANFHDGLRPVIPEWLAGRMSRRELGAIALAIGPGFVVGSSLLTLATGVSVTGVILVSTDLIGAFAPNWRVAALGGGVWSAFVVVSLTLLRQGAAELPVNVLAAFGSLALPLVFAFIVVPAIAVGYQFGVGPGAVTLVLVLLAWLLVASPTGFADLGSVTRAGPDAAALVTGLVVLLVGSLRRDDLGRRSESAAELSQTSLLVEERAAASANAARLRQHLPLLMVQAGLVALAINLHVFSWQVADAAASANGASAEASVLALTMTLGFLPLIATGALLTGVYQAIGLGLVFPLAYLAPHPIVAVVGGALIVAAEISSLTAIGSVLDRYPSLRESADSLRTATEKVMGLALVAGALITAGKILPGTAGYLIVAGVVLLNEVGGQKLATPAAAILATLCAGLLANVLVLLGMLARPA